MEQMDVNLPCREIKITEAEDSNFEFGSRLPRNPLNKNQNQIFTAADMASGFKIILS